MKLGVRIAVALVTAGACAAFAQEPAMDKARGGAKPGDAPLSRPDAVLKVVKVKGRIEKTNLEKRTVTIAPGKKNEPAIELSFPQPNGREQIKVSKKAQKLIGKKKLELEEVQPGSKVALEYYPALGQVMSLTIEKPGS